MIRTALILAAGSANLACSADRPSGNAVTNEIIAKAPSEAGARGRELRSGNDSTMSKTQIVIASERGRLTAELVDNDATRALVRMLPVTVEMRDHLRQEKTGNLPSPLPEVERQTKFSAGTIGLWGNSDFVIYYDDGRVPQPGIIVLGHAQGNLSMFDNPEPVTIQVHLGK
jgi:hypothetical protein